MSRRYKRYDDDLELLGFIIIGIISYVLQFIINNWKTIICISVVLIILVLLVLNRKNLKNFYEQYYIKRLKKKSQLYLNIKLINDKYNLVELKDFIDYYSVSTKNSLYSCNIDDYLMMTIHDKYNKLVEYKRKYDELKKIYSLYLEEYDNLYKYINKTEANKIRMSVKKYYKYQNMLLEEQRIKRKYEFKIVIYINYKSKKGQVRKSIYKCYNPEEFLKILSEYKEIKESQKINEINSRIERAKMSASIRYDVLKRDNYKCSICGKGRKDGVKLEVDHIIPVSKGGKTIMSNLQTLCDRCNRGKSNKL